MVGGGVTLAQHEKGGAEKGKPAAAVATCPISGEPVNLAVSTPTPDGPVFFCCKDCIAKYKAEAAKFSEKVAAQRKALEGRPKAQVLCPICQKAADRDVALESGGKTTLFCSEECMNKYKSEPAKYASALANSYTYQTKCPVMGEEIDPKAFTTLADGTNVYFCCKGCTKKLFADPAKYAPKLAEQGIAVGAKDLTQAPADQPAKGHEGH